MIRVSPCMSLEERIEHYSIPEPNTGCRLWFGPITSWDNRPQLRYKLRRELVARWVSEIHEGPIPKGIEICHSCANGMCVEHSHLFRGTHFENMQDRNRKGRARGPQRKKQES